MLGRARAADVNTLICVGYDLETSRLAQQLAASHDAGTAPRLFATAGLHPHDAKELTDDLLDELRQLCLNANVVAVGECGLDFFRNLSSVEEQRKAFAAQIELAVEIGLPLVIHDRDAHDEVWQLLKAHRASRGVMHCFSGDWAFAEKCLDLGFHISIAGPVTYKNARDLPEVARRVPADRLVIETDSPYLPPHPYRGARNEPARVRLVAECVAALRGVDVEVLAAQTSANAAMLFGI